jgi:Mn-dependent DtxR family transcriptional regulator
MSYLVIDQLWERRGTMEKKILDAMKKAGKPVRPGDVAKMIGADGKEVSKVIKELKKQGKVTSPKNCFYEPA